MAGRRSSRTRISRGPTARSTPTSARTRGGSGSSSFSSRSPAGSRATHHRSARGRSTRGGARVFAQSFVRRGVRQPEPHRRVRRRRRRGGDRSTGHGVALEQVPRSRHRRRGPTDPAPQRLQDCEPHRPRANHARGARAAPPRLRVDAVLRGGARAFAHARGDGLDARRRDCADQEDPGDARAQRQGRAPALADDCPEFTQGVDRAEGRRWAADRGDVPRAPGAHLGSERPSRAPRAPGRVAQELPPRRALR